MTYRIELTATAKADIRATTRWLCDEASQAVADRWLAGLHKTMATLATHPLRSVADRADRGLAPTPCFLLKL
jgi:plasmid stabilization system protein ParE